MKLEYYIKETVRTLIDQKGEARGIAFQTDEKFILFKDGVEKLGEIESQIGLLIDEDFKYDKIDTSGFYPSVLEPYPFWL